jgi:two-component sensor histidine kinase
VKYLLALLLLLAFTSQAEPVYPLLSKTKADSLRHRLWQSPPDTNRVKLLVQLSFDLISKQYYSNKPIDSATAYIRQAQALSQSLHYAAGLIDSDYARGYLLDRDWKEDEARKVIAQAVARSHDQHDRYREGMGWFLLNTTSGITLRTRIQYCERATQLFRALHNQLREAQTLKEIADVHLLMGKPVLAREELLHVLVLYRACGHRELQYSFDLLAAANDALGNYKEALQYALDGVQHAKSYQDTAMLQTLYMRIGGVYQQLSQPEKTIQYYQLALHNATQYQNQNNNTVLNLTLAIAKNLIVLNRPHQALALVQHYQQASPPSDDFSRASIAGTFTVCYLATKQYQLANLWRRQLELLSTRPAVRENSRLQEGVYSYIGRCYLASHQYSQARTYLSQSLAIGKITNNRGLMARTCLSLFQVDSAQGNLPSAIAYYKRYKTIQDSVFNETNSKQIAALQIQYDTEKRKQSIALLTKRNLVQQMIIRQREFQRNAVLGGAGLLVLVLSLGYNRYRLKQRSSLLLEQKQHALEVQQAEINRKNQALEQVLGEKDQLLEERQELLVEKDWMLKEIHHRVKNNLQVVSSLLSTQSRHLHDPQALAAIRESQNRVQVMALLHQKLYQAHNIGRVNMAEYGREIVTYLVQSFDRQHAVQMKLDLAPVELETTLATPLGLIINEAVTNALKHAFPPPQRGNLTLSLVCLAPQQYELSISDDGVGLPPGFDLTRSRSLGMIIIKGLSRQIDGHLAVSTADGVCISLQFDTSKKPVHAEAVA